MNSGFAFSRKHALRVSGRSLPDLLAVVMYQSTLSFVAGGQRGSLPLRLALTLVREGGQWRIRQGLASQIAE
jgi:hypothetical protein